LSSAQDNTKEHRGGRVTGFIGGMFGKKKS
jgi:hypothetical protein